MKILVVVEASGGVGRHVLDLCEGLVERGLDVHLVFSPLRADGAFLERLDRVPGITVGRIEMQRSIGPADGKTLLDLMRYIAQNGPFDVIHGHSSKAGALVRMLPPWSTRAPKVYTPHAFITMNPSVTGLRRSSFGLVERLLDSVGGSHLIAVSPEERDHALELGIAGRKVSLVINGVDIDVSTAGEKRAAVRRELGLEDSHVCIGFVGRLTYQKAPEILIKAYKTLRVANPNLRLVMLGDGEELDKCRTLLGHELTDGTAHILAGCRGIDYMPAFDVFALPSRYEGMAYVHLEAAAFGLPIVTSAVAGATTVVSEGVNGFLAKAGDLEDFTAALARGVEMVRERNCAEAGVGIPSIAGMVDQVVSIYRQVRAQ